MLRKTQTPIVFLAGYFLFLVQGIAQVKESNAPASDYQQVIHQRAYKIVVPTGIADSAKFYRVEAVVANQYMQLGKIHDSANAQIKIAKANIDKDQAKLVIAAIEKQRTQVLEKLHVSYLQQLGKELSQSQIDQIKDGMTYNIVNITYKAYGEMILSLNEQQKKQILTYLLEARELAMDAESSNKKHEWFGKYKGRINNYLSAAGYDMKKEGEEWQKRIKEQKLTNTNS
ncbi:MAG: hypothetical protein CFE25_12265 [Chitinophagaceae bacterium BSSC1]|nr:MAG: hypothetical protein CFE25_12265 [Chitinophagaceae bacterium BSSC1]